MKVQSKVNHSDQRVEKGDKLLNNTQRKGEQHLTVKTNPKSANLVGNGNFTSSQFFDRGLKARENEKNAEGFLNEYSYVINLEEPADFGDTNIHYVENPEAKIFGQRIYNAAGQSQGSVSVVAAAAVVSAAAAVVSAAAAVTSATSAAKSTGEV